MNRRTLLTSFAAPFAIPFLKAAPKLTIESFEIFRVKVNQRGEWVLLRLKASNGLTGLGDASHGAANQGVINLIDTYFKEARGRSPFDVEMYRRDVMPSAEANKRNGAVAFSAIEQAMWDLQGKALGLPVWALFGGRLNPSIRHYANINRATFDRSPEGFAKLAELAVRDGFDAIKMASFDGLPKQEPARAQGTNTGVACVEAVRKVIGPTDDLLVDGHSNFNVAEGLEVARRLEPSKLFWFEEICRGIPGLAELNEKVSMKTAGGESIFGTKNYYPYIKGGAVDITMPDIKYCGGLLETRKIGAMSEAAGLPVAPHGPASPVGNAAAAQVCAAMPNFLILELGYGEAPWRGELINPPEVFEKGGILRVSDRPGLGIELNDKVVAAHAV
ncbi:MAG: mandelate racemase/muconate lactonizing enzyme family protein [Acidobacteriota bacterium]